MSSIVINFDAPTPGPTNGYIVKYRRIGAISYTTLYPPPLTSPITINGISFDYGYEGTIQCNCSNSVYSQPVSFSTQPCIGDDKKVIMGVCQTGIRNNISAVSDGMGMYICTYNYLFTDGSHSVNLTETNIVPCLAIIPD